jgi:tetratricopeptide (TPR) repeat protein
MSDDDIKPDDMARLINEAESSDKATHASEALTNAVSEAFIGVPSVARSERYATMTQVRQLMWQTRLDDAERLVAPHAASDLGFMLAWTELALWRATMHETPEHHAAVRHRIAVLDAHATAAFDRLHPDRATRSASTLGWLTGQTAADHPGVADVAPLERQLAFCDAALVLAFAPVARAALDVRAATAQSIVTGAYYLRKAWKSFEVAQSAIDKVPAVDADLRSLLSFAVGAFQLAVSMVPASLRWFVELIGFRGDRAIAAAELGKARRSRVLHREATLMLAGLKYYFHGEQARAEKWFAQLRDANADSPLIMSLSGSLCRAGGRCREALTYYDRAMAFQFDAPQFRATIAYHYGMCNFALNNWAAAAQHLRWFLDHTQGKVFRPYAAWRLGVAHWHLKEVDKIAPLYEQALGWIRPHESYDQYAELRMRRYLATRQYDALEEIFDAAEALHEGREDKQALELLDKCAPLMKANPARDNFALLYYLKGACLRRIGQGERATKFLRSAIGELTRTETKPHYAVAYALAVLGEQLEEEGNVEDARKAWNEAKALRGCLWERMLAQRIASNFEKLERKQQLANNNPKVDDAEVSE